MLRRSLRNALILFVVLPLAAFRMPGSSQAQHGLLYDVRGAFVTAKPDIRQTLVTATDALVDMAIQATVRSYMLPRTILAVRIVETSDVAAVLGVRRSAKVTVQAIAVSTGEPVAEGSFTTSVFSFNQSGADRLLAEKIAARIANEFRLVGASHGSLASALSD
jgi:hypothetical protein